MQKLFKTLTICLLISTASLHGMEQKNNKPLSPSIKSSNKSKKLNHSSQFNYDNCTKNPFKSMTSDTPEEQKASDNKQ